MQVIVTTDRDRIVELDEIQWAIQRCRMVKGVEDWRSSLFFRNRDSMLMHLREMKADSALIQAAGALPEWFQAPGQPE